MAFDVEGAKRAGYTDAEIADFQAQPQGGHRFTDAPPEEKPATAPAANATDFADVPGGGSRPEVRPQPGTGGWGAWVDTSMYPNPNVAGLLPFSVDPTTHHARVALPNAVRAILTQGPQGYLSGPPGQPQPRFETPAATINPDTGTLGVTPEALGGASLFGPSPLMFGGANRVFVPPGTFDRRAPLSPEFLQNPLGPSMEYRQMPEPDGPASATGVPSKEPPIEMHAVPNAEPPAPPPAGPAEAAAPTPSGPINTAAGAKAVANAKYTQAEQLGGTLTPQFTDKFLDSISAADKQTGAGRATSGPTELSQLVDRYTNGPDAIKGQPLSLRSAQEIDEGLGDLIDKHFDRLTGLDKEGYRLMEVQRGLRDQIKNAGEGDITGSADGFNALVDGRQAYAQFAKMRDLERMKARADGTQNPTSSFRTQVNNINTRGYSPEEIAAVNDAADRGVIGGALHVMGSRLLPHVGGAVGASVGGIPGFIAGEIATHVAGGAARSAANAMQTARFNRAMSVFGSSVPNRLGPQP
jgi:hypothetical protein